MRTPYLIIAAFVLSAAACTHQVVPGPQVLVQSLTAAVCSDTTRRLPPVRVSDTLTYAGAQGGGTLMTAWRARRIPGGWAGGPSTYGSGAQTIWLRDTTQIRAALAVLDTLPPDALRPFGRLSPDGIIAVPVRYDYAELYDWVAYLRSVAYPARVPVLIGSPEPSSGRIGIGIADTAAWAGALRWLEGIGVPCHLVYPQLVTEAYVGPPVIEYRDSAGRLVQAPLREPVATARPRPPPPPPPGLVSIMVTHDSVVLYRTHLDRRNSRRTAGGVAFTVAVVIKNPAAQPLFVDECGPAAEREINGIWEQVWWPACAGGARELGPGHSLLRHVNVFGSTDGSWSPQADPRLAAGKYRLRFWLGWGRAGTNITHPLAPEDQFSNSFVVEDAQLCPLDAPNCAPQ